MQKKWFKFLFLITFLFFYSSFPLRSDNLRLFLSSSYSFPLSEEFRNDGIATYINSITNYKKYTLGYLFEAGTKYKIEKNISISIAFGTFAFTEKFEQKLNNTSLFSYFNKKRFLGFSFSSELQIEKNIFLLFNYGLFDEKLDDLSPKNSISVVSLGVGFEKGFTESSFFVFKIKGELFNYNSKTYPQVSATVSLEKSIF